MKNRKALAKNQMQEDGFDIESELACILRLGLNTKEGEERLVNLCGNLKIAGDSASKSVKDQVSELIDTAFRIGAMQGVYIGFRFALEEMVDEYMTREEVDYILKQVPPLPFPEILNITEFRDEQAA